MKLVALEEHFLTASVRDAWAQLPAAERDLIFSLDRPEITTRLEDFTDLRIKQMDASGVDVQVLSLTSPGVQNHDPKQAVELAQQSNDTVAAVVKQNPDRFDGFATLPTPDPEASALELKRAVTELGLQGAMLHGRTGERNLDHADFAPIFEMAAYLRAPLYIHPQPPQRAVREIYYSGFGEKVDGALATFGWGWHHETGVQAVRLILAGVFDRYPDLQIVLGHWGECLLFYLDRINGLSKVTENLKKPIADYVRENFYVTPGGILSANYLKWAIEVIGRERVMFATDYPYQIAAGRGARDYIEKSGLDGETQNLIANGNWQRITAQVRRENSSGSKTH